MTTNFETRRDLTVSKNFVVPVVPSLAAANIATPGSIVFDKSTGNLNVSSGSGWSPSNLPIATPTVRGIVFGSTNTGSGSTTSLGYLSGTAASSSVFVGYSAGSSVAALITDCTAVGFSAMSTPGVLDRSTAVGASSGNIAGLENTSVGANAASGSTGNSNVCFGYNSGINMTGSENVIFGTQAADGGISGPFSDNVVVGFQAGRAATTASGNVVVGQAACPNLGTCTNCIVVGRAATAGTSGTNRIVLGASAVGATDNELTIAPTITQWRSLGLSSAAAANTLQINPATGIITQAASSRRFKENIRDLEVDTSKLYELALKTYEYKTDGREDYGLIAEDTHEILPEIVTLDAEGNPHGIKHLTLVMLLVAELQNLKKRVEALE
ncbi:low complexity HA-like repeat protein [Tokyovirus A1]|uniref:low complexity HA-like repeat protein n=1 Tax=Tokyovirus A1 TaxID=1826170 RepID=UPI0007A976D7|nr:low complexity HA-like repeat protein [Tokyovirus A1]BAU80331.1 low complexity HA-like repeat protein [Tokyovirus A1]